MRKQFHPMFFFIFYKQIFLRYRLEFFFNSEQKVCKIQSNNQNDKAILFNLLRNQGDPSSYLEIIQKAVQCNHIKDHKFVAYHFIFL